MSKTQKVSIRIIIIFTTAIFLSFIPEHLHEFFGDWYCKGSGKFIPSVWRYDNCVYTTFHNSTWHWGYRHWLYFSMGICLALIQVYNLICLITEDEESKP